MPQPTLHLSERQGTIHLDLHSKMQKQINYYTDAKYIWLLLYTGDTYHVLSVVGSHIHKSQNKRKTLSFQCCNKYLYPKLLVYKSQCYILPFSSMDGVLTISGQCLPLMSHSSSILSPCCTGRDGANAGQTKLEEILKIYDHKYTCE